MSGICPCTLGNSVAGALFNLRAAKELSQKGPEQSASAIVLSRKVETVYSLTKSDSSWGYFVIFRTESGEQLRLKTPEADYTLLKEGLECTITWQDDTLIRFSEKN